MLTDWIIGLVTGLSLISLMLSMPADWIFKSVGHIICLCASNFLMTAAWLETLLNTMSTKHTACEGSYKIKIHSLPCKGLAQQGMPRFTFPPGTERVNSKADSRPIQCNLSVHTFAVWELCHPSLHPELYSRSTALFFWVVGKIPTSFFHNLKFYWPLPSDIRRFEAPPPPPPPRPHPLNPRPPTTLLARWVSSFWPGLSPVHATHYGKQPALLASRLSREGWVLVCFWLVFQPALTEQVLKSPSKSTTTPGHLSTDWNYSAPLHPPPQLGAANFHVGRSDRGSTWALTTVDKSRAGSRWWVAASQ